MCITHNTHARKYVHVHTNYITFGRLYKIVIVSCYIRWIIICHVNFAPQYLPRETINATMDGKAIGLYLVMVINVPYPVAPLGMCQMLPYSMLP